MKYRLRCGPGAYAHLASAIATEHDEGVDDAGIIRKALGELGVTVPLWATEIEVQVDRTLDAREAIIEDLER